MVSPSDELYFIMRRLVKDLWIPPNSMSGNELGQALLELCTNKNVLEFGSGGSTLLIGKVAKRLISIESDRKFARNISNLSESMDLHNTEIIYANIGPVKSFGQPIEFFAFFYRKKYQCYTDIFYNNPIGNEQLANVVFIDGRFRVWCAIESIRNLRNDFLIIFDDYLSRSEYQSLRCVLGDPYRVVGDAAFFVVKADSIKNTELATFEEYRYDFR